LKVGEANVTVAVTAPHRGKAFEAAGYAIDRLKEIVPIWKKEFYEGGEEWIEEWGRYRNLPYRLSPSPLLCQVREISLSCTF